MRSTDARSKGARGSRGFSLLEVLVSIVVVTIGLLSLAGLSIRSLAANDSSGQRATAAYMALYAGDLMRSNLQTAYDGGYNVALGAASPSGKADPQSTGDVASWKALLATLPEGDGSIQYTPANQTARVLVQWNDVRGNAPGETATLRTYEYSFRP